MEATAVAMACEVIELIPTLSDTPSPTWEEELELLAFEVWQRGCCPEADTYQDCSATEVWYHPTWQ